MSAVPAPDVLDLDARRRIFTFVQTNPGLHLRRLAQDLDMPLSTLDYHTHQLVRHGRLVTREEGGYKAFYPAAGMDRRDRDVLYLLRQDVPRRICMHLLLHPGATPGDLKGIAGVSAPTLSFHLKKMRKAGIIQEEPAGRTKRLDVNDPERVANVLVTYQRSFVDDVVDRFAAAWSEIGAPGRSEKERRRGGSPPLLDSTGQEAVAGGSEASDEHGTGGGKAVRGLAVLKWSVGCALLPNSDGATPPPTRTASTRLRDRRSAAAQPRAVG